MKRVLIKFSIALALLAVAYLPTLRWMYERWVEAESYYGHGFLIPLISVYVVWQRRSALKKIAVSGSMVGLYIIAACLMVHIVCAALKVYFISGFTFVIALYGLILFFFGKEMTKNLIFPIFFLYAMIPLPLVLVGNLTVKLKLFAAQISTLLLNWVGFPSIRDGSVIRMPGSFIEVAAPCSGLRSIISLLTLGLIFAYAMKISFVKKAILFLSSIPIAIATNVMRIMAVAIVNDLYGGKVAMGTFHDVTGYAVFVVAFLLLLGVSRTLEGNRGQVKDEI